MTATLDLNLLPIARYTGRDYPELLGLHFSEPPRRTARGRSQDRLVLYLAFEGNSPLAPEARDRVLADLSRSYYRTVGSVTSALRKTADELNQVLLERNRQLGANRQCVGLFVQVVLREDRVYLAQSGQTHAYLIGADAIRHVYDPELSGRGLGLTRAAAVSFSQVSLKTNDVLLLAALPSQEWSPAALASVHSQGPESLRRRLYSQTGGDLNAVALQAKQGKGEFILMRQPTQAAPPAPPVPSTATSQPVIPAAASQPEASPASAESVILLPPEAGGLAAEFQVLKPEAEAQGESPGEEADVEAKPVGTGPVDAGSDEAGPADAGAIGPETAAAIPPDAGPAELQASKASPAQAVRIAGAPVLSHAALEAAPPAPPAAPQTGRARKTASIGASLAGVGASIKRGSSRFMVGLRNFLGRMLPDETFLNIPSSVMALVAIAVPVVVVTAASMVYFRLGRAAQYDLLSAQARQMALQAMEQTDQATRRADLGAALSQLQKAEGFAATPEDLALIQDLRTQVRSALDELDYVRRVSYQPAIIGGVPVTSNIIGMAAFEDDLYLLDSTSGSVLRAYLTDHGYELDFTFHCQPGKYSEITVGPLIEVIAWPAGYEPSAKVIASDSAGNVLYCRPAEPPIPERLTRAEAESWGNILETTLDQGDFYTLDLPSNGVWIYWRSDFSEQPTLFFDQEIPPLQNVRDMLVDRDDLYMLQMDGSMMLCSRDTLIVAPTDCSVQAYIDRRPGRENLPLVPPASFIQVISTPPPDPSLFLLEPSTHAAYHFSLRSLAFQKQYLPETPLPAREASSFAINSGRRYLYMALGNQVFYAAMP